MNAPLTVRLLGRFRAEAGVRSVTSLGPAKVNELCAFLLLRPHPCSRQALAAALWEGALADQGRAYLRRALWQLQIGLRERLGVEVDGVFAVEADWLARAPGAAVELDIDAADQAAALVRDRPGASLSPDEAATVERALRSYRGDLLETWAAPWADGLRAHHRSQRLALLEKAADYHHRHGRPEQAIAYAGRLVAADPERERSHRTLMRLHWQTGDRVAALRQYQRCAEALDAAFGLRPTPETVALGRRIRAGAHVPGSAQAFHRLGRAPTPDAPVTGDDGQRKDAEPPGAGRGGEAGPLDQALDLIAEATACLRQEMGRQAGSGRRAASAVR